jgi:hypothetical protein
MSNSTQRPWKLVRTYRAMVLKRSLGLTLGKVALENIHSKAYRNEVRGKI